MNRKILSVIYLNSAVLIWSGTAMFAKGISLPLVNLTCIRYLWGAAFLLILLLVLKNPILLKRKRDYAVAAVTGGLLCLNAISIFQAIRVSTAGVALLSFFTYPVITTLVEPFFFRERLRKLDLVLAGVIVVGVLIMTPEFSLSNQTTQGILFGILGGVFFMFRSLIMRRYLQNAPVLSLMFWQMVSITLMLLPFLPMEPATYTVSSIWLLVLLGTLFSGLPQTLFTASLKHLSARTAGVISTLQPIYTSILGYLFYREGITVPTMLGGGIILGCAFIEMRRNVQPPGRETVATQVK